MQVSARPRQRQFRRRSDNQATRAQLPRIEEAAGSGFVVKISTFGMTKHLPATTHGFGLAAACGPREAACTAYVFYGPTRHLSPRADVDPRWFWVAKRDTIGLPIVTSRSEEGELV